MANDFPPTLPLLDWVDRLYGITKERLFGGHRCLIIQHLLGSSVSLLERLEMGGIDRDNLLIVGKAYSSHPNVLEHLYQRGYSFCNAVEGYSLAAPYDDVLRSSIRKMFERFLLSESGPVLLLDDAGKGIQILHQEFPDHAPRFRCVELTSRGARTIGQLDLRCPVINVARCWAKTLREAPIIADSMVRELIGALELWRPHLALRNRKALVLGYGFIGEQVCSRLLLRDFDVTVFEPQPDRREKARANGLSVEDLIETLPFAGLIVGCTGSCSLLEELARTILPGALLVNMASSDLEFGLWRFHDKLHVVYERSGSKESIQDFAEQSVPWRCLYRVDLGATYFFVANGGFPIDFSGDIDPIPPSEIQLTRALLLVGAVQAIRSDRVGLIDVDEEIQSRVVGEFDRLRCESS